jgi:hypothetical protein
MQGQKVMLKFDATVVFEFFLIGSITGGRGQSGR